MTTRRQFIVCLWAVPAARAAQSRPDFSGRWRLDTGHSSPEAPEGLVQMIEHVEPALKIGTEWNRERATGVTNVALLAPRLILTTDGKETVSPMPLGMSLVSTSEWRDGTLVTNWTVHGLQTRMSGSWVRRLSGASLILDAVIDSGGQRMARHFVFVRDRP